MEVTYTGNGGYPNEVAYANKRLKKGEAYYISDAEIGRFRTVVFLDGVQGAFNSCLFDGVDMSELKEQFGMVDDYFYG